MTVVTVAGRLTASAIGDLQKKCSPIEGSLTLDLSGLVSADDEGLVALRELEKQGAEIRGSSPFIRLLLTGNMST